MASAVVRAWVLTSRFLLISADPGAPIAVRVSDVEGIARGRRRLASLQELGESGATGELGGKKKLGAPTIPPRRIRALAAFSW